MAVEKRGAKARRILTEKENIANIAKWLLVAFCLQFVFYIGLINIIPMTDAQTGDLNSFYSENWINYKGSKGNIHVEGNGIKFIYAYNMVLLVATTGLVLYYAIVFMEEYEGIAVMKAKQFFKENKGLMFLVLFMIWTFISSCLAYDHFRSFIGCYNLRDGFFSFAFYGSVLILILLMGLSGFEGKIKKLFNKIEVNPKKLIVDIFVVVMTIIALITLGDYNTLNYNENFETYEGWSVRMSDDTVTGESIGISIEPKIVQEVKDKNGGIALMTKPRVSKGTVTSSVFNNSNHYAYVLSIAVIVAAVMFIKTKNLWRVGYLASFVIMTGMLIINDTFGAYLGVMIALILMFIHAIIVMPKNKISVLFAVAMSLMIVGVFFIDSIALDIFVLIVGILFTLTQTNNFETLVAKVGHVGYVGYMILIFTLISLSVVNTSGENIVVKNFDYISQSISAILGIEKEEIEEQEVEKQIVGVSGEQYIVEEVTKETTSEQKDLSNVDADDAGSGRWKLWVGAWKIISSNYRHTQKYIENGNEKIVLGDADYDTYLESGNEKKVIKNGKKYIANAKENIMIDGKKIYIPSGDKKVVVTDSENYIESGEEKISIDKNIEKIGNITINTRFKFDKLGDRIKDSLFGDGLENFIYEYAKIEIGEGRSHNLVFQLAGTVGIPGLILYILGVAFIFFKALKYFKVWDTYTYMGMFVMVSYLISSLTGNSGFYTSGYFYIFVGFVVVGTIALSKQSENEKKLLPKAQNEKNVIEVMDKKWRKRN